MDFCKSLSVPQRFFVVKFVDFYIRNEYYSDEAWSKCEANRWRSFSANEAPASQTCCGAGGVKPSTDSGKVSDVKKLTRDMLA